MNMVDEKTSQHVEQKLSVEVPLIFITGSTLLISFAALYVAMQMFFGFHYDNSLVNVFYEHRYLTGVYCTVLGLSSMFIYGVNRSFEDGVVRYNKFNKHMKRISHLFCLNAATTLALMTYLLIA